MRARLSGPPADRRIYAKASALLQEFDRGRKVFSRTRQHGYLHINVTAWWRLLSKDAGKSWHLVTHVTFEKEVKK
ncbi:hypothetical protein DEO48_08465 [Enterobacter sp. CGMCC 5087]|uniref:ParE family toxin-like protein n=1 Tax=Enterobacter sp. CGMCC 5087 TaxID=2183878 RepID=UPI000D67822A|nr:hypothetical protein [Enterobacter sp. CGMCC 5087]PWI80517.1 hypothetical protein DEO48_08465 [Enterobacter sp. CGMCC 5087]